mmetsp:Transcript_19165/g.53390  ORF Transcript_19165/g.53390 Transcript_19165/m.53390 type:complete len:495 (+) Transcript_19165:130-1614(+)
MIHTSCFEKTAECVTSTSTSTNRTTHTLPFLLFCFLLLLLVVLLLVLLDHHQATEHEACVLNDLFSTLECRNGGPAPHLLDLFVHQLVEARIFLIAQLLVVVVVRRHSPGIEPRIFREFLFSPVAELHRIESLFFRSEESPRRCLDRVVLHTVGEAGVLLVLSGQLVEPRVVDPGLPDPSAVRRRFRELVHPRQQHRHRVLVLARQVVLWNVFPGKAQLVEFLLQVPDEVHHLVVPRRVGHVEVGGIRLAAKGHSLDLHQRDLSEGDQFRVSLHLVRVPPLDHREAGYRSLSLVLEQGQGLSQAFPGVRKEGPVDGHEALGCRSVDAHVELRDGDQALDGLWVLAVGDQKGANVPVVQVSQKLVDPGVHDGFSHQRQGAVPDRVGLLPALGMHPWDAPGFLDHFHVRLDGLVDDEMGIVRLPAPLLADGILVVPPAKDTLVGAGQARCRLHALVRRNAIKGVFVASTPSPQLVLGPAAQLDGAVRADQLVSLLL